MGLATSCGCETSRLHDLTGKRFGKLTVISRAPNGNGHGARWNCRCDCGKEKIIYANHLEREKSYPVVVKNLKPTLCLVSGAAIL